MGIELVTKTQDQELQKVEEFDLKKSSWIKTPFVIRKPGGVYYWDLSYDGEFVYHNGAQSYFATRGFRGLLRVS